MYIQGDPIKRSRKRHKRLLKTVIKDSIPQVIRPHAYLLFSGGFLHLKRDIMNSRVSDLSQSTYKGPLYSALSAQYEEIKAEYEAFLKEENPNKKEQYSREMVEAFGELDIIDKDLKRTYLPQMLKIIEFRKNGSEFDNFEEIERLEQEIAEIHGMGRKVMMMFSLYNPKIGYVQGMNSVVGALCYNFWVTRKLLEVQNFEKGECLYDEEWRRFGKDVEFMRKKDLSIRLQYNEREIFYVFCGLIENYNLDKCFGVGMGYLQDKIKQIEFKMKSIMPQIYYKMCGDDVRKN